MTMNQQQYPEPSHPPERPIRFVYRGRLQEVQGLPPTTTVLTWLREHARCTGTKEGCNEGDCGACTVVVAQRSGQPGQALEMRNVNACLLFLPALDGRALFTVEDLAAPDGSLHPVQQAMVDHHASQCGFCTPGFVMSIWSTCEEAACGARSRPDRQGWADALAGNLCRCTGYRPILDAAQDALGRMTGEPAAARPQPKVDLGAVAKLLDTLGPQPDLHYAAHDAAWGQTRRFFAPTSSDALAQHLLAHPADRVLGGASDIGLWVNKGHRDVGHLVAVERCGDLQAVDVVGDKLHIGAAVTLENAWRALAGHWPDLQDLWRRFASPPVRHAGTLAGNVANGSPIGDAPPVLMALAAALVLRKGPQRRRVPLDDFYLGYQRNCLEPGEFIEAIEVPLPVPGQVVRAWKISKRYDSDISALCGGFGLQFEGDRLLQARLAFGGMAATVRRAPRAEAALLEHGLNEVGVEAACAALEQDYAPLSDLRATAGYRLQTAAALLRRLLFDVQTHGREPRGATLASPRSSTPVEVWR